MLKPTRSLRVGPPSVFHARGVGVLQLFKNTGECLQPLLCTWHTILLVRLETKNLLRSVLEGTDVREHAFRDLHGMLALGGRPRRSRDDDLPYHNSGVGWYTDDTSVLGQGECSAGPDSSCTAYYNVNSRAGVVPLDGEGPRGNLD